MSVMSLDQNSFNDTIQGSSVPVLVDFYADWCQPCKQIAPLLEEIAAENGDAVRVCKVDVSENPELAEKFGVMSIPFVMSFKDGKVYKQSIGAVPKAALLGLIE